MPYDELGNFYGDSDIPNSPPTTDLDAMKLALENQQVRQKSLQNRSTPESYNRTQQALSLLPGQVMPNGQSPIPVKPPISTATNIPQALLDVSGASALPQTLLSMGTGYAEALAKSMGLDDVADKLHYEPTSKYANDINEALGNLASKTGPLPELMFMGKNRTVTPSDVQVLGARAIETGRQLKRLPEDFQASQEGLTRLGADNEPTIGAKVQKGFESFGDYLARTEGKPRVTIAGLDVGKVIPDTKLYAVRKTNEGFVPRQEVPETGGDIVQIRNQTPMSELDKHIVRSLEDMPMVMLSNDEPNEQAMTDYLQRFVFKDISSYKGDNSDVKHNHDLNNAYDNFKNKKLEELFSNVGNIDRYDRNKLFSSVYNDAQRKALEHQWFDEFTKAELKDLTFNTRDEIKDNVPVKDANGKIVKDENGNNVTKEVTLYKPKDLKFPSFEEHKKRMEAAKIIMNEVYPNYIQKFLGTPDDPLLMKAKEGITMKESSTFPNVETDPTAHMSLTEERRRREAGFPERGQFYDEYLNQLDEHEKVQNAYQNALAELEQTPPFIDNARNPQWSAKKKVFDKLQKPLDDSQKKLDNLRLAMSYERQADLALKEKTTAKNYLDEKSAINRAVFPSILKANPDTPIYDINQDYINSTGSRLLVRSLVNDVLSGEKSILDKNGQPDPNIVRSTNIASYIDDVVKPRLIEEAKNKRDTEKIANDYKQENVQIMKRALSRMPKAGNYGTIVPNLVNNRVYTPDEIRQILSNITWELDHCIGQDGRDQVNRMHNTGDKRNYLPKLKPLTLEPFNKKTGNNDNPHIRGTIDGTEEQVDFRDSTTGTPIFTMQLESKGNLEDLYDTITRKMNRYYLNDIDDDAYRYIRDNVNNYSKEEILKLLTGALDLAQNEEVKSYLQNQIDNLKNIKKEYVVHYFMGYKDKNTLNPEDSDVGKDALNSKYLPDIVKWLNDNESLISGQNSNYMIRNGIADKKNGQNMASILDDLRIPSDEKKYITLNDFPNRFVTKNEIEKIIADNKEKEKQEKKSTQQIQNVSNGNLTQEQFQNKVDSFINDGVTETFNYSTQTGLEFQNEVEALINNVDSPRELIRALNRRAYEAENSVHDDMQTLGRAYRNLADNIELLLNENRHIENNELANAIQGMEAEAPQRLPEQAQATPLRNLLQEATGQMAREPRIPPRREIGNDANQTTIYHADTVDQIAHWLTVEDSSSRRLFYGIVDEISQLPENQIKGAINTYINWARSSINDSDEHQLNNIDANGMNHVHAALKQLKELVNGNTIIDRRIDDIPEHNYMDILSYNGQGILDQAPRYVNGQTYIDNISQIENYLTNENSGSKQAFNSIVSELRTVAPDNILNAVRAQINYLEPRLNDENTMQTFGVDSVGGMRQLVRALAQLEELLNGRKALLPTNNPQGHKDGGIIRMANGGQTIAEKANEKLTEKEQSDAQSTAPFSLFGMTSPTDPRILEGSGLPPPDMGLLHVGHNQLFDIGNLSLGATGISMATPQGRINKLSGVDVGFEHPSGIYGRINKPIGGQSPRYEVGYRKSFADGGVANTQNSAVFDTMGNYAGMDTSMPTTQPTQTTQPKVDNFEQAMNVILPMEGGYNNVKGDSPTNYGIKQNTYSQYLKRPATVDDVRNMPIEHAKEIYRQNYWNPLQADSMDVKPAIVAFDAAVNQGLPFAKHIVKTTNGDIEKMLDMRQQRYNQSAKNPTKARFKKGWDNRLETIKNYALEDYYQDGGEVKKKFPTPEFQKLYEDMVLNAKPDPNTQTVNERLGRETVRLPQKPTVGLQPIGSGFGGSDGAKGTQLHLFEKKGGKVVSLAKMRAELNTRNR